LQPQHGAPARDLLGGKLEELALRGDGEAVQGLPVLAEDVMDEQEDLRAELGQAPRRGDGHVDLVPHAR